MMTRKNKEAVYKIGLRVPFLYVCSLIICFLLISASISGDAFAGEKAWLGIQVQPLTPKAIVQFLRIIGSGRGVLVSEVTKGSPAEQMGVKQNDVILSVNYNDIKIPNEFTDAVSALNPGDKIVLLIFRGSPTLLTIEGTMGQPLGSAKTEQIPTPLKETTPVSTDMPAKIFAPIGQVAISKVAFSPDGRYALSRSDDGIIKFWDINTGEEIKTFSADIVSASGVAIDSPGIGIVSEAFSPDRRYMLQTDRYSTIKLLDVATGKEIRTFTGHKGWIPSVTFFHDGKSFISGGKDGTTRLWDISTGKELAQFVSFTDGEWIVLTPEGYFNASPNGAKHLNVRVGSKVYSIDNFYEKFFNPVYVASVLQGKKIEAVADIRKGILPPPDVRITSPEPDTSFSTDTVTITVSAKDTGGGIDEIRLYHNGKAIGEDTRAVKIVPKGNEAIKTYTVTLVDGNNIFRATAFSKDRTESNPYELTVKLTEFQKDVSMYVFAVGINKYKNPALNLNYAEPDAKGIADFFKQKSDGLFKRVDVTEIYNEQATKEIIISKLKQLENTNPQDAVLIYLAGHGENINDKWYFIPHELTYPEREEDVKTKGISSDELSGYIKNIKAQKILVLIDACKAGAVLIAFRGFEDRKALSQLSRSTGVHIIAASTKDQFAAEVKDLGHGVFTYTLLEGLKGKVAGKGEPVTVRKLMGYIEEKLPEITKKYKQEAQYPVVDSRGMDFPLVLVK